MRELNINMYATERLYSRYNLSLSENEIQEYIDEFNENIIEHGGKPLEITAAEVISYYCDYNHNDRIDEMMEEDFNFDRQNSYYWCSSLKEYIEEIINEAIWDNFVETIEGETLDTEYEFFTK